MRLTWSDLKVEFNETLETDILEEWTWLIGNEKEIILISSIGDLFLRDKDEKYYWLDVGIGEFTEVANSRKEFENKLNDETIREEWFLIKLVRKIRRSGKRLEEGKVFSYKILPIIGGAYEPENFELTLVETHFNLSGQIHRQLKDLPDGTRVNIKTKD